MSELASSQAFYELAKTGKYSKTWLTNKINQMQAHESQMAIIQALQNDPELKYYLGVALGSAAAVAGAIATGSFQLPGTSVKEGEGKVGAYTPGYTPTLEEWEQIKASPDFEPRAWPPYKGKVKYVPEGYVILKNTGEVITREEALGRVPKAPLWLMGPGWMAIGAGIEATTGQDVGDVLPGGFEKSVGDFMSVFNNAFSMVGMGFAGFCAAVLLLKAVFGEDGLSQLPFSGGVL